MSAWRKSNRRGFTLAEMLIVFFVSTIVLGLFYDLHYGSMIRYWAIGRRVEGEQAVRILLTRLRHELRSAVGLVRIDNQGRQITIPLLDPLRRGEDGGPLIYYRQYEFDPAEQVVVVRRLNAASAVESETLWLGGRTPIENFLAMATSENDRILFQYYRVIIEVDYYDIRSADRAAIAAGERPSNLIRVTCTVYPRRINQELRIDVPQEGGAL